MEVELDEEELSEILRALKFMMENGEGDLLMAKSVTDRINEALAEEGVVWV